MARDTRQLNETDKEVQCQTTFVQTVQEQASADAHSVTVEAQSAVTFAPPATVRGGPTAQPAEVSDTSRSSIIALARAYVAAYDDWWMSLVTPPFNAYKDPAHDTLDAKCHAAFLACGGIGIQAARAMIAGTETTANVHHTNDDRRDWEITWCIDLQIAASYITMTEGTKRCLGIHDSVERANAVLARANRHVAKNGPLGSAALIAARGSLAVLRAGAFSGLVPIAGIVRTDVVS